MLLTQLHGKVSLIKKKKEYSRASLIFLSIYTEAFFFMLLHPLTVKSSRFANNVKKSCKYEQTPTSRHNDFLLQYSLSPWMLNIAFGEEVHSVVCPQLKSPLFLRRKCCQVVGPELSKRCNEDAGRGLSTATERPCALEL